MSRPAIGLCTALERAQWGIWDLRAALLPYDYVRAIQDAGGVSLMIPPDTELEQNPGDALDRIDALVLAGGADIDPAAYGAAPHPATHNTVPERDRSEIALVRAAIERDMPVLGICRGMQLINVALGGTLHQHVPELVGHEEHRRNAGSFENSQHDVRLEPGSVAARAATEERHVALSHHHQAVARLGEGLLATGYSAPDDLVETIEIPSCRFVLGVQWHPEADESSQIVAALVEEARQCRSATAV
ncbi:MAG TPA: gamma-glutamyl-gamma-aminobutyrate hydrolase family protein [Solirubrobacteraceae bacterium]|jgi:putative glutamine amidotransferase